MATTLRKEELIKVNVVGTAFVDDVRIEIDCDTPDDLPNAEDWNGKTLHQGSIALVISTGDVRVLDSEGNWNIF